MPAHPWVFRRQQLVSLTTVNIKRQSRPRQLMDEALHLLKPRTWDSSPQKSFANPDACAIGRFLLNEIFIWQTRTRGQNYVAHIDIEYNCLTLWFYFKFYTKSPLGNKSFILIRLCKDTRSWMMSNLKDKNQIFMWSRRYFKSEVRIMITNFLIKNNKNCF